MAEQDGYLKETKIDDVVQFINSEEFIKIQNMEDDDTLRRTPTPPIMLEPEPEEPEDEGLTRTLTGQLTRTMTPPIENA